MTTLRTKVTHPSIDEAIILEAGADASSVAHTVLFMGYTKMNEIS